jgi:TRAP transporter 4TM/12TM fusion protein
MEAYEVSKVGSGKRESWQPIDMAIATVGVAMAVFHLMSTQYLILGGFEFQNAHLGFALLLVLLTAFKKRGRKGRLLTITLLILSLACIIYVGVLYEDLEIRAESNTSLDLVVGVIIIFLVLETTRQSFGWILPIVAIIFIAYAFLGSYIPGALRGAELAPSKIISNLSIGLSGVYGLILSISASYIFLFVFFGTVMQVSGATGFFEQVGRIAGRKLRSGAALSSVVTSALVGTITGSVGANIATTGSFTIPLMKRVGYKPEQAGAIEAAASSGGQIMPPIMGAAAFAMAGVTGIPYLKIAMAAAIPAILYFLVAGLYTYCQAGKMGISSRMSEKVDYKELLLTAPLFVIPLFAIVYCLMVGKSLMYSAFNGIMSVILLSLIRKKTRVSLATWVRGFTTGALAGAEIAMSCACMGLIVQTLTLTGLGMKLPALVETLSGGNVAIALSMVALISIILGCGVSTLAVYILVVMVSAPVLLKMGIPMLQAHFFVFFYACFSMVTPPIGMGSIIASKLAGAKYMPTAVEAVKVSLAGFILPVLIIWNPVLILEPTASTLRAVLGVIACLGLLVSIEILLVNYYILPIKLWERALYGISSLALLGYFVTENYGFLIVGLGLIIFVSVRQFVNKGQPSKVVIKTDGDGI